MATLGLILNDASFDGHDLHGWVSTMLDLFKACHEVQSQIKKIRCSQETRSQIFTDMQHCMTLNKTQRELIRSLLTGPYIPENEEDLENNYILSTLKFPQFPSSNDCGLVSHLSGLPLLSNNIKPFHDPIVIGNYEYNNYFSEVNINNIAQSIHVNHHEDMLRKLAPYQLPETSLSTDKKEVHFQSHHGINTLNRYVNKIKPSPFIVTIESGEFKSQSTRFVYRHYLHEPEGHWYAVLVLYQTNEGYSYLVRTTARSKYEADLISAKLEQLYPF